MIRLNNVRLSYTSLRPSADAPLLASSFSFSVPIVSEIRRDVAHAIRCMHFGLVYFAHVRIMRTSPKWSLLP